LSWARHPDLIIKSIKLESNTVTQFTTLSKRGLSPLDSGENMLYVVTPRERSDASLVSYVKQYVPLKPLRLRPKSEKMEVDEQQDMISI